MRNWNKIYLVMEILRRTIFYMLFLMLRKNNFVSLFLGFFQISSRFGMHILMPYLLTAVFGRNMRESYIYAISIGILYFIYSYIISIQRFYLTKVSNAFRYGLIFLMIKKILTLPQFTLKKSQVGKMLNLISNDLNAIQQKFNCVSRLFYDPLYIISVFVLIIVRYRWAAVASIRLIFLAIIIILYIQMLCKKKIEQINQKKDKRLAFVTEIVQGIKFIKIYGWQIPLKQIIAKIRNKQLKISFVLSFLKGVQTSTAFSLGNLFGIGIIIIFYFTNRDQLNSIIIFSILQVCMCVNGQMVMLSFATGSLMQIMVVLQRYSAILNIKPQKMTQIQDENFTPKNNQLQHLSQSKQKIINLQKQLNIHNQEINQEKIIFQSNELNYQAKHNFNCLYSIFNKKINNFDSYIQYSDCSVGWTKEKMSIENINLNIHKPSFIGVAGKIGCGKSTLLSSIIQEIPYYKGYLEVKGKVGYVEQEPILFSMSIKDNILFQKPYDEGLYKKALKGSDLITDIKGFPQKDFTLVGQKGITLSGGQKSRLALARALYTDPQILVLDDPFSAVDPKVGQKIFKNVILQQKTNKIIILATHHIHFFQQCDYILFLEDNKIVAQDNYQKLYQRLKILNQHLSKQPKLKNVKEAKKGQSLVIIQQKFDTFSLVTEQLNQVKLNSYFSYFFQRKLNYVLVPLMIVLFISSEVVNSFAYRFLSNYDKHRLGRYYLFNRNDLVYWLAIFGLLLFYFILNILKFILIYLCCLFSNKKIHQSMLFKLIRAPLSYFDKTPSGNIISRFSNDLGILDNSLALTYVSFFSGLSITAVMTINIFEVNLIYIIPCLIQIFLIVFLYILYKKPLKRTHQLDLIEKSPLFSFLSQNLTGMFQIKNYASKEFVLSTFNRQINNSSRINYAHWLLSNSFDSISFVICGLNFIVVILIGLNDLAEQKAGQYSLVIVFIIQVNYYITFFIKQLSYVENSMMSYQRVQSIINIQSQAQLITEYDKQKNYTKVQFKRLNSINSKGKVSKGKKSKFQNLKLFQNSQIQIQRLSMRYSSHLPLIIDNLYISISKNQKIGVVGRTGAGKSSIVQFLLRLTQPEKGSIYKINGQDVLKLGLHTLRRNISVIPQKTFFFNGTLRKNLDPFDQYSDEQIWIALQHSNLKNLVQNFENGLENNVSIIENTFSVGQRQLLSLVRVILRKNSILILDQATSSVDSQTDQLIQKKIKEYFSHATVFTIAHRLSTIADYDKIVVIDKGSIIQFDTPSNLLMKRGAFWQMVQESGAQKQNIIQTVKRSQKWIKSE